MRESFEPTPAVARAMDRVYERGDRLVGLFLVGHTMVALPLAWFSHTWVVTLPVTAVAMALFLGSRHVWPRRFVTRCVAGVSLQTFVGLHLYQLGGLHEMHFFFTAFAVMIVYQDWVSMWPGTVLIIAQHIVFAWLPYTAVPLHFWEHPRITVFRLFFHFGIAIVQVAICGLWAHLQRRQTLREVAQTEAGTAAREMAEARLAQARASERALAEKSALLLATLENTSQGLSVFDGDLRLRAWNRRLVELLDLPDHLLRDREPFESFIRFNAERGDYGPGDIAEQVRQRVELARRFVPHAFERTTPGGVTIEIRGNPMPEGGFVTTYLDVSDRKAGERAIGESERRVRQIIDSALDAVVSMDAGGRITGWNPRAESTFGWSREEAVGRSMAETIVPPRYREAHQRGLRRFFDTGEGPVLDRRVEVTALRRDGSEFPVELTITVSRIGPSPVFSAFIRDISEQKRAAAELARYTSDLEMAKDQLERQAVQLALQAEELAQARDEALAGARAKSDFLATMSHEIRTPMNGVIGMTGLLLDTELDAEQREYAETIRRSGDALLAVINDVLDFSKIESGRLELETLDFDPRSAVEDVLELVAEGARAKTVELAGLVHAEVPAVVRGDPGRLRQVLTNLVGNAVKFTEQGEVVVDVTCAERSADAVLLRLEVRDTGIGIPSEAQGRLFRSFSQVDASTTRQYGGTGLGLAICKRLSELMGGQIGVDSVPGRGSTFWFTIRCGVAPLPLPTAAPRATLAGRRALVVDDHAVNRTILGYHLRQWGLVADEADGGPAALARLAAGAARGEPYDLALLDLQMPGQDGLELARAIRQRPALASVRLLLLTSASRRGQAQLARDAGIAVYLTKPARPALLLDALIRVLAPGSAPGLPADEREVPALVTRHSLREERDRSRLRLLVAEDNAVNQRLTVRMLEKRGIRADVVANGREALEAVRRRQYDLVLMDCQMPEMDGFEATAAIRQAEAASGRRVPIVALTANAMEGDRERCLAAGMDDYLAKPVKAEALDAALDRMVGTSPTPR